jgi:hypothetical protein
VLHRRGQRRGLDDLASREVVVEDGLAVGLEDGLGCAASSATGPRRWEEGEGERKTHQTLRRCVRYVTWEMGIPLF